MRIKISPWFSEMVDVLWDNRAELTYPPENQDDPDNTFDYPNYGGLPKRISNKLQSDTVDMIQENQDWLFKCRTKKEFTRHLVEMFFGEFATATYTKRKRHQYVS